jgi:hypothetical protein
MVATLDDLGVRELDRLAKKYLGLDEAPGDRSDRIKFLIKPERVRHVKR